MGDNRVDRNHRRHTLLRSRNSEVGLDIRGFLKRLSYPVERFVDLGVGLFRLTFCQVMKADGNVRIDIFVEAISDVDPRSRVLKADEDLSETDDLIETGSVAWPEERGWVLSNLVISVSAKVREVDLFEGNFFMQYGLLFYFSEDFTDSNVLALEQSINELAMTGEWPAGPPEFVDSTDSTHLTDPDDEPIRTVGGFLPLLPPRPKLDRQTERACYEATERLVDALSLFSEQMACEFELELGGTYVGDIAQGKPDELVTVGLLAEWRKYLWGYWAR